MLCLILDIGKQRFAIFGAENTVNSEPRTLKAEGRTLNGFGGGTRLI